MLDAWPDVKVLSSLNAVLLDIRCSSQVGSGSGKSCSYNHMTSPVVSPLKR